MTIGFECKFSYHGQISSLLQFLFSHINQLHAGLFRIFLYPLIPVELFVIYRIDSAVGDQLKAIQARRCGHVDFRIVDVYPVLGRLSHSVGFSVNGAYAVSIIYVVSNVVTVRCATETSVVASGKDDFVADDDRTDVFTVACTARRDFFIAEFEDVIIGSVKAKNNGDFCWIGYLMVDPNFRN
jgi:hypothetical protein